jgi:hypothetical protein
MGLITILTESMTFFDEKEARRVVVDLPDQINLGGMTDKYVERHNAIVIIVVQVFPMLSLSP